MEIGLSTEGDTLVFQLKLSFMTLVVLTLMNNLLTMLFSNAIQAPVVCLFESKYDNSLFEIASKKNYFLVIFF